MTVLFQTFQAAAAQEEPDSHIHLMARSQVKRVQTKHYKASGEKITLLQLKKQNKNNRINSIKKYIAN